MYGIENKVFSHNWNKINLLLFIWTPIHSFHPAPLYLAGEGQSTMLKVVLTDRHHGQLSEPMEGEPEACFEITMLS